MAERSLRQRLNAWASQRAVDFAHFWGPAWRATTDPITLVRLGAGCVTTVALAAAACTAVASIWN